MMMVMMMMMMMMMMVMMMTSTTMTIAIMTPPEASDWSKNLRDDQPLPPSASASASASSAAASSGHSESISYLRLKEMAAVVYCPFPKFQKGFIVVIQSIQLRRAAMCPAAAQTISSAQCVIFEVVEGLVCRIVLSVQFGQWLTLSRTLSLQKSKRAPSTSSSGTKRGSACRLT